MVNIAYNQGMNFILHKLINGFCEMMDMLSECQALQIHHSHGLIQISEIGLDLVEMSNGSAFMEEKH